MIALSLIPLFGVILAAVVCWFIQHSNQGRLGDAREEINGKVHDRLRRGKALDGKFVQGVTDGNDLDDTMTFFTKERAAIHSLSSDMPWMWEADDLNKWATMEQKNFAASLSSRTRMVSFVVCASVFVGVLAIEGILYSQISGSTPVLAPQAPPKKLP